MRRPVQIWVAFALCLAVGAASMAWLAVTVTRLERMRAVVEHEAQLEGRVRLALWRMDAALGAIVARESLRPHYMYTAFYPAEQVYTRLYAQVPQGEVLVVSPLLTYVSPQIRIHFQVAQDGTLTSPQAPEGNMRDLAETGYVEHEAINAAMERLEELRRRVGADALLAAQPAPSVDAPGVALLADDAPQSLLNSLEFVARDTQVQEQRAQVPQTAVRKEAGPAPETGGWGEGASAKVSEGDLAPTWIGDELFLMRRVTLDTGSVVQGCWLDWATLRPWLLGSIRDLLPEADLRPLPIRRAATEGIDRRLAALPVVLEPGDVPDVPETTPSPTRLFLWVALAAIAVATGAIALLLWGALALSERRGAFVSAVTHELRTPLTTFQMYTEMLAGGMVSDEAQRRRYLDTLCTEAGRLVHLVENVLAYARLERRPLTAQRETIDARVLLDAVVTPLTQRARQAGMELVVDAPTAAPAVRVDRAAVERILFNLVDNACKYARDAQDRRIHVQLSSTGRQVAFQVCDHGPGIPAALRRQVFRPFAKGVRDPAHATPGVGLGLGLSRRLAHAMRGRLELEPGDGGACLVLRLPACDA